MISESAIIEHSRLALAETPVAAPIEEGIEHWANGLTEEFAEVKIQNTTVVPDEGGFLQNPTGIPHRHALADSQVFQVRRHHTATSLIAHLTLQTAD
jgi:hypothetical protein